MSSSVRVESVRKAFGPNVVIHQLDLEIQPGEFMVLVGPSGCGKSTLLRMVAGLEEVTEGTIRINDRIVNDLSPKERGVSMVFQNYALYPHMSVRENLAFGLKLSKLSKNEIEKRVSEAAGVLAITEQLDKKPGQLSGGQRQRVAMGRAMVRQPDVFFFDEPLSNLDAQLRVKMRSEISLLHRRLKSTIIYVTHDQVEAMTLADRIAVMHLGKVEQVGPPLEVYHHPKTKFVASFIGTPSMNFLPSGIAPAGACPATAATIGFRPESTSVGTTGASSQVSMGAGKVSLVEPLGMMAHVHVRLGDSSVVSEMKTLEAPKVDAETKVWVNPKDFFFFDAAGARV